MCCVRMCAFLGERSLDNTQPCSRQNVPRYPPEKGLVPSEPTQKDRSAIGTVSGRHATGIRLQGLTQAGIFVLDCGDHLFL